MGPYRKSQPGVVMSAFLPEGGHSADGLASPLSADTVAKVENRTIPKISQKLIFRRLYRCNAL
jgi:hypothetical protein